MRLDKYISSTTDLSRKEVKRLLKTLSVSVNGIKISSPARHVTKEDVIAVDNEVLPWPENRYFMLHKPRGYICANKDGDHPIALDLLDEANSDKLQIAGRLDIDTTGLVLITDDGKWNHAVTSPRRHCTKVYYVHTAERIDDGSIEKFASGILLEGEKSRTKPAILEKLYENEARLKITEGKYHQVKRMFGALGNRVDELHRESIGSIVLDPELEEGEYRPLTREEIESVYR